MGIFEKAMSLFKGRVANEPVVGSTETGTRLRPEDRYRDLYRQFYVDPSVYAAIVDVREMDRRDGRVKQIHNRVARDVVKGGLIMKLAKDDDAIATEWQEFCRRTQLNNPQKLKSDARGFVMEGNLPLQTILDDANNVAALVRMPSETIVPNVNRSGQFKDVTKAFIQHDLVTGTQAAEFALWQLNLVRLDPDNFDDMGSLGRPFLDASRETWRKLRMTEEDLVIRRRTRAPLRLSHVLEGASETDLQTYEGKVISKQNEITTDFFSNKKGSVNAVQGDSNLDQIADISLLLDAFFSGSPMPKGLAGYTDGLNRDILEDLTKAYYDEIDLIQDTLANGYEQGFRLHLLLKGKNPDDADFCVGFAERRTETPNQAADRGLKLQALGIPQDMIYEEIGFNPAYVRERRENSDSQNDPYPDEVDPQPQVPQVRIVPGNAKKGNSATSITNR